MQNNLVCVHTGYAYGPEYVLNLWRGIKKYSNVDFNFVVFTDNSEQHPQDLGWKFVAVPNWRVAGFKPWWYKMEIFNKEHNLVGNNLYVDLDTVVVGSVDKFWTYESDTFRICQDFNRAFASTFRHSNSSVMAWKSDSMDWLHKKFVDNKDTVIRSNRGDQDYICKETVGKRAWWPREWAMSWKWEIERGGKQTPSGPYKSSMEMIVPKDTSMIVCHGKPNPNEVGVLEGLWNGSIEVHSKFRPV